MRLDKKTIRSIFLGVAGCILLYWLLHETERMTALLKSGYSLIAPFVTGAVIAFILNVPMRSIERKLGFVKKEKAKRGLAILLTFLAVILVLTGVVYLLVPQITETAESFVAQLPEFFKRIKQLAIDFLAEHPEIAEPLNEYTNFEAIDWSDWIQRVITLVSTGLSSVVDGLLAAVVGLSTGVFNGVLSLVFAIYCLSRKEILARQGRRVLYSIVPEKFADETVRILRMTNVTFSRFISGQCLEAVILGAMFAVTMPIFNMPFMPLVSVTIAVTALVPIVGAFAGCIVGAFFILVQDPMLAVWFVVMFLVLQQIEGNLIYPKVVGRSIGLPGMWVLVAVGVGGGLMGVAGMLIMIPLASVLYALAREFTDRQLATRNIPEDKLQDQPMEVTSKFREKRQQKREERLLAKMQRLARRAAKKSEEK